MLTFDEAVKEVFKPNNNPIDDDFKEASERQFAFDNDVRNSEFFQVLITGTIIPFAFREFASIALMMGLDQAFAKLIMNIALNFLCYGVAIGVQMEKER